MIIQKALFIFFSFLSLLNCFGQKNNTYTTGVIPGISDFMILNDIEKQMIPMFDEINFRADSLKQNDSFKKDFKNNRSRVFMNSYSDGKVNPRDTAFHAGLPIPCDCSISKDSFFVYMNFGFFGGFGFNISVVGNKFQSRFFEYIDDVKPYKMSMSDTVFNNYIQVDNTTQSLIFDKKPTFAIGQQITGYLTYSSSTYFEQTTANSLENKYVSGYLYFTCKTRQRTLFDQLMFERK